VAKKILIADDNLQIRMLVKAALSSLDCEILESVDGESAIEVITNGRPDLVLLDVMMPKLTGFEVLHFLRNRECTCDCRVVMLTTAAQKTDIEFAEAEGVEGYITKPFVPSELKGLVSRILFDD